MSDAPPVAVQQEWVTLDQAAFMMEQAGVREGEAILNAAIRSGHVPVRGKTADNPLFEELPETDRAGALSGFQSRRGMSDFQIDWTGFRDFMSRQSQIPGVDRLPPVLPATVNLSEVIPPAGARQGRGPFGRSVQSPGYGFWANERPGYVAPEPVAENGIEGESGDGGGPG